MLARANTCGTGAIFNALGVGFRGTALLVSNRYSLSAGVGRASTNHDGRDADGQDLHVGLSDEACKRRYLESHSRIT